MGSTTSCHMAVWAASEMIYTVSGVA